LIQLNSFIMASAYHHLTNTNKIHKNTNNTNNKIFKAVYNTDDSGNPSGTPPTKPTKPPRSHSKASNPALNHQEKDQEKHKPRINHPTRPPRVAAITESAAAAAAATAGEASSINHKNNGAGKEIPPAVVEAAAQPKPATARRPPQRFRAHKSEAAVLKPLEPEELPGTSEIAAVPNNNPAAKPESTANLPQQNDAAAITRRPLPPNDAQLAELKAKSSLSKPQRPPLMSNKARIEMENLMQSNPNSAVQATPIATETRYTVAAAPPLEPTILLPPLKKLSELPAKVGPATKPPIKSRRPAQPFDDENSEKEPPKAQLTVAPTVSHAIAVNQPAALEVPVQVVQAPPAQIKPPVFAAPSQLQQFVTLNQTQAPPAHSIQQSQPLQQIAQQSLQLQQQQQQSHFIAPQQPQPPQLQSHQQNSSEEERQASQPAALHFPPSPQPQFIQSQQQLAQHQFNGHTAQQSQYHLQNSQLRANLMQQHQNHSFNLMATPQSQFLQQQQQQQALLAANFNAAQQFRASQPNAGVPSQFDQFNQFAAVNRGPLFAQSSPPFPFAPNFNMHVAIPRMNFDNSPPPPHMPFVASPPLDPSPLASPYLNLNAMNLYQNPTPSWAAANPALASQQFFPPNNNTNNPYNQPHLLHSANYPHIEDQQNPLYHTDNRSAPPGFEHSLPHNQ
jgi:hypothetical protein